MNIRAILSLPHMAIVLATVAIVMGAIPVKAQPKGRMKNKILFVVASNDLRATTGEVAAYLPEISHPWSKITAAGYQIDFVSPEGGKAAVNGSDLVDAVNKKFGEDPAYRQKISHTMKPSEVDFNDYIAIHYAGGPGSLGYFVDNKDLALLAQRIYENGGIVSAVYHGPPGSVNIKIANGRYPDDNKKINVFTNEGQAAIHLGNVLPLFLGPKFIRRSAMFNSSRHWQSQLVVDQWVVTGRDPQWADAVGDAVVNELGSRRTIGLITRYEVKEAYQRQFSMVLNDYVVDALANENNIMAELYVEPDSPAVFWVIERWADKASHEKQQQRVRSSTVASLAKNALVKPARAILVKDLEPLPAKDQRTHEYDDDKQLTIMLFVDARPGTETQFRTLYHEAMPQFRGEPGVVTYQLSQLIDDETKFVTYEKFRDEAAFQYHLDFPPIQPLLNYLNTSIRQQPFQRGLHKLKEFKTTGY